ncbi:hypothetical protein GTA08_BOTSDO11355 [Botryosphaeria dothidea]|uniref:Uncharacterized protein n=1 Tax=Botryosphaeria dothidea TaxID=55169 RepID=A0A8H4IGL3_9PEZI|nr:hypothetical protein GTA08_BOTSDO11355 [Botryosphaeria dothidea]
MSFSYDRYDRRSAELAPIYLRLLGPSHHHRFCRYCGRRGMGLERTQRCDDDDDADLSYGEEGNTFRPPQPPGYADDTYPTFGAALGSIREEDREDYGDHSRWSEEAARRNVEAHSSQSISAVGTHTDAFNATLQPPVKPLRPGQRKRTVVVVVSADAPLQEDDHAPYQEHPVSLVALHKKFNSLILAVNPIPPSAHELRNHNLFVLVYAPSLKPRSSSSNQPGSLGSSYSAISTPAQTPGDEALESQPYGSGHNTPKSGNTPSMTASENSIVQQHLCASSSLGGEANDAPDLVYLTEDLSGVQGEYVEQIRNWVGQVMIVVGAGGVGLGLVDTEDEGEGGGRVRDKKWWETTNMIGLGKCVEVVDSARLIDDFERRVGDKD